MLKPSNPTESPSKNRLLEEKVTGKTENFRRNAAQNPDNPDSSKVLEAAEDVVNILAEVARDILNQEEAVQGAKTIETCIAAEKTRRLEENLQLFRKRK